MANWKRWKELRIGVGTLAAALLLGGFLVYEAKRADAVEAAPKEARGVEPERRGVFAEGRIVTPPGAEVTVSPEIGGRIVELYFKEQDRVEKGQKLALLATTQEEAQLREARARAAEAKVDVDFYARELARTEALSRRGVLPSVDFDRATHAFDTAKARVRTLAASIARLEDVIEKATLLAPLSGTVTAQLADAGEVVAAGVPLVTIVDLGQMRVEVEVGEFDIPRVKLEERAVVRAEGFEGQSFTGEVTEIPSWVTSRRLKPLDPGRPSDTRVLPVKVSLPAGHPFKWGQRVEVEIGQ